MPDPTPAFAAAVARHQAGDLAAAERMYRAVLADHPGHAPALCNLGVILARTDRGEEAERCYRAALAADPRNPDAHFNLGNLYRRAVRLADAAAAFQACLAANPRHAAAFYNLGLVYAAAGHFAAAADCFRRVAELEPANADAHARLGDALIRSGQLADGVAACRRAVTLKPDDPRGLLNLGLALCNVGQPVEAQELLHKALRLNPGYAEAHNALGLTLEAMGRKDDALFHYQESVRIKPDLADGWSNAGTNLGEQGRIAEAIPCLRQSLAHRPLTPAVHSNLLLLLNYPSDVPPEQVTAEHLTWAERFAGPTPDRPAVPPPHDPDRRLKVGYLSADYRNHTVAGFIETLLRHHDRSRVEVFAYASVLRPDDTTARLRALADHWRPVGGLTDDQAADQVRTDGIDCLIDLSGHTAGNRLLVLARRPAPVQALLFGYPNTTGMRAVDYRITDPVSDPPGRTEHLYAENLLRLPETAWVYAPPENAPPVTPLPAVAQKWFTFGCLNNPAKISDACLAAWARILRETPGTRLVLMSGQSQVGAKRLADRFTQAGILRDRVELLGRLPKEKYFEAYGRFDLSLDPFPYNGGVTTGDSLWMGVPVITVAGPSYVARQGAMVMQSVGLGGFVADSADGLVALAKEWTTRRAELAEIRAGLRDRVAGSPIGDGPRYVRNLEAALRNAWREALT